MMGSNFDIPNQMHELIVIKSNYLDRICFFRGLSIFVAIFTILISILFKFKFKLGSKVYE